MRRLFGDTPGNPNVSNWDVSSVERMGNMFKDATNANPDCRNWNVINLNDAGDMFDSSALSVENLTACYENWSQLNLRQNVSFSAGTTKYNASGQEGRDILVNTYNWTITDGSQVYQPFIIEVDTSKTGVSNADQFQFTGAVGDYDVVAKQNDIVVATFNDLSNQETITFANGAGTYTLEVNAKEVDGFTGMRFNNSGDKEKITKNLQWGIFNDTRQQLFYGCSNLTEIGSDVNWLNSITNGFQMFTNCSITSLPSGMTLANLNKGFQMFGDCNLTSLPSEMTLAILTDGFQMFSNCSITSLPSEMILANLNNGTRMFKDNSLTDLPSGMTLANLTDGERMFGDCNLTSLPSEMTLANLTNGDGMFSNCSITSLPSGMTLANLTNGDSMFINNTINTARYSTLLVDMEDLNSNANVPFNGGDSQYNTSGETARNLLIANQNWIITDGGLA
jgi:hypothetical protein